MQEEKCRKRMRGEKDRRGEVRRCKKKNVGRE
jgi:hypothetical protein